MVQLLEVILIEIVEEAARADRMPGDFEIVNVPVPSTSRTSSMVATRTLYYELPARDLPHDCPHDTMICDPRLEPRRTFDLLVVGGGIYGLTIAYDAAQRGLSVALVERGDFGSGASFNHLRTIHGGLRYLQSLDIGRARESIRERRTLARIAPQAVRPLPFVAAALPIADARASWRCAPASCSIGSSSADRNRGVPASHRLPGGRVVSREQRRSALSRAAAAAG